LVEDLSLAEIIAELATDARLEVQAEIPGFLAAQLSFESFEKRLARRI